MSASEGQDPEWREFERLVARIEADADPGNVLLTLLIVSDARLQVSYERSMQVSVRGLEPPKSF